ncbi:MAG: glutamate racemase [Candidatus Levyibacteriota bacterium]
MKDTTKPIGIFDSGVGGLSILSELKKILPYESFIYVADQAYVPYGSKTRAQIVKRSIKITDFLIQKEAKLIVVACNTATISSIQIIRKKFSTPIIGVVPVVKTAAERTKTKKIAVFATPATAKSKQLQKLIRDYAQNVMVCKNGSSGLEKFIEAGEIHNPQITELLNKHLLPLKDGGVDVIALGCTHYPFLKQEMQKIVGDKIQILDSGGAVARHAKRILEHNETLSHAKEGKDWYYTTGEANAFSKTIQKLLGKTVEAVHVKI